MAPNDVKSVGVISGVEAFVPAVVDLEAEAPYNVFTAKNYLISEPKVETRRILFRRSCLEKYVSEFIKGYLPKATTTQAPAGHFETKLNRYFTFIEILGKPVQETGAFLFYVKVSSDFAKRMWEIHPNPVLSINVKVDIGPNNAEDLPWTSGHCAGEHHVRIPLIDCLKNEEELYRLECGSDLPFNIMEPQGEKKLRLSLDVELSFVPIKARHESSTSTSCFPCKFSMLDKMLIF